MNFLNGIKDPRKKVHDKNGRKPEKQMKIFRCYKIDVVEAVDSHSHQWSKEMLGPMPVRLSVI